MGVPPGLLDFSLTSGRYSTVPPCDAARVQGEARRWGGQRTVASIAHKFLSEKEMPTLATAYSCRTAQCSVGRNSATRPGRGQWSGAVLDAASTLPIRRRRSLPKCAR